MSYMRDHLFVEYLAPSDSIEELFLHIKNSLEGSKGPSIYNFSETNPSEIIVEYDSSFCFIERADSTRAWGTEYAPIVLHDSVSEFDRSMEIDSPLLSAFLDIAIRVYEVVETPVLAYGVELYDMNEPIVPNEDVHSPELDHFPWLTFFSPARVEQYSRERLLSAPAPRVEELDDGSIVLVTRNPLNLEADTEVAAHLGIPSAKQYYESRQ